MHVLGWPLAPVKHIAWSQVNPFCGTITDFTLLRLKGIFLVRIKPTTVAKVRILVAEAIEKDFLSPAQAASLRGKLLWVWLLNKFGRARLHAFADRQYSRDEESLSAESSEDGDEKWPLGAVLLGALLFVQTMLSGLLPDIVFRAHDSDRAPIVVLSDAMWHPVNGSQLGAGTIAWIVWIPLRTGGGLLLFAFGDATESYLQRLYDLREQKNLICPLEESGIASPYFSKELEASLRENDVLHFADNKGVNAGARRAYSAAADLARIVSALYKRWAYLGIDPWLEYVASAANLSDDPSTVGVRSMNCVRWVQPSWRSFTPLWSTGVNESDASAGAKPEVGRGSLLSFLAPSTNSVSPPCASVQRRNSLEDSVPHRGLAAS